MSLRARLLLAFVGVAAVAVLVTALVSRQSRLVQTSVIVYDVPIDDAAILAVEAAYFAGGGTWDAASAPLENIDFEYSVRALLTNEIMDDLPLTEDDVIYDSRVGQPLPDIDYLGYYPVGPDAWLYTFDTADPSVQTRDLGSRLDRRLLVAAAIAMGVATIGAVLLSQRISRPVHELVGVVRAVGAGDREVRAASGSGEIGELGGAFNQLTEGLERSERVRRSMAADTAHELRTPLANLRGHLEAVQDGVVEANDETVAGLIADVEQLSGLVDDLQALSLAEAGAVKLDRVPASPASIIDRVVSAHRERAIRNGVTIGSALASPALPLVSVDSQRIEQVFDNLVSNATRYAANITLSARAVPEGVAFDVVDDGPGIPADHLDHIFERFHRVDPSRQRSTGGGGLGLAIARQMTELHGGTLSVVSNESGPDRGTTFTVSLPAAE